MAYSIDRYNSSGTPAIVVEDGTINTTLDLKLIGKNYAGYGEAQNENFLWLLENFASRTAPPNAVTGQLWYDSDVGKLKLNYGAGQWRTAAITDVVTDGVPPVGLTVGDFWWNSDTEQLFCRSNNSRDIFIGGQLLNATTQIKSETVTDSFGNTHQILEAVVDSVVTFTISDTEFTLGTTDANMLTGFTTIYKGITLSGVTDDKSTAFYKVTGTVTDADNLGGLAANLYINDVTPTFTTAVTFPTEGFTVGSDGLLVVSIDNSVPTIKNNSTESIVFKTTNSTTSQTYTALTLFQGNILPGEDSDGSNGTDIGSSNHKFHDVYAYTFHGALNGHNTSEDADAGTIPVRTQSAGTWHTFELDINQQPQPIDIPIAAGSIYATEFAGKAYLGTGADLAEKYLADNLYEVGTVLMIGGSAEVTAAQEVNRAIGVVSDSPAYIMNVGLTGGTIVALKGRVPVKVTGLVKKGDRLISSDNGVARSLSSSDCASLVFAIALTDNVNTDVNTIEALIL